MEENDPKKVEKTDNKNENSDDKPKQRKINKAPVVKKAKLLPKNESKHKHMTLARVNSSNEREEKRLTDTTIFILPLMPTEEDEKKFSSADYRCGYCHELCDDSNLECKVCFKIAHISCLYKRGYLESEYVPQKIDWSCADCSDLTKCLTDEEMRKIINIFDQLDFRKNCFVKLDDYIRIKKKMAEDDGGLMTTENEIEEKRRFHLMDLNNTGSITWNEFVDFETAHLLSRKNKVELSNHLSKKELIVAKKKFLSYDKEKMKMINKEDAKACYMEYIKKIKDKLGGPMEEHINNCAELFGFKQDPDAAKSTAKTMWPEFVRKITILLLYDRLNSKAFRPRYWKPGNWFLEMSENETALPVRTNSRRSTLLDEEIEVQEKIVEQNKLLDINSIMANNLDIDNFKPHDVSEFGSFNYMIRSKNYNVKPTEDEDTTFLKFKNNKINLNPINRNKGDENLKSTSFNISSMNSKRLQPLDKNNPEKTSIENLFQGGGSNLKLGKLKGNSCLNLNFSNENLDSDIQNTYRTNHDFEYSKVTDDIYKTFGKPKQSKYNYPQQIHVLKTSRKPVPDQIKNEDIKDLIENSNYQQSVIASKNDFFGQSNRSMVVDKNRRASDLSQPPNKYSNLGGYRDGSRLIPLESSRLDNRSINGGTASNMSSATNFSTTRNNKLLKILGEY